MGFTDLGPTLLGCSPSSWPCCSGLLLIYSSWTWSGGKAVVLFVKALLVVMAEVQESNPTVQGASSNLFWCYFAKVLLA